MIKSNVTISLPQRDIHVTVCMPGYKPNHGFKLCCDLGLHDGRPGLRINFDPDVKLSSVGNA